MKELIICFLLGSFSLFSQSDLITYERITVGKQGDFKSIEEALGFKSSNVHLLLDSSVFINDNGYWIQGDHVILEGNGASEIQCRVYYENVLWLNGNDITVRNLKLRHFKPGSINGQNCSGRVIGLDNCTNVLIENCDINGCGLAGIHDNLGNSDILVRNNYIHNNSLAAFTNIEGAYWMEETDEIPGFTFVNNRVENNGLNRVYEYEEEDLLSIHELADSLRIPLSVSLNQWESEVFDKLLNDLDVDLNCKDCPSVAVNVALVFDLDGILIDVVEIQDAVYCRGGLFDTELKLEIIASLSFWEFPSNLKDMIIECRVGRSLRC